MTSSNGRTSEHQADKIFLDRFSPRAFTGEAIPEAEFMTILEAAHWAPSSYNSQPWRFVYALRDTPEWDAFLPCLVEFNQSWAKNCAALIFIASKETMQLPGKEVPVESYSHSFDTGAAWAYLALQASLSGWAAHAMVGFDMPRAAALCEIPAGYRIEAAIAIGRKADASTLPEAQRAKEIPNSRAPLETQAFMGKFKV